MFSKKPDFVGVDLPLRCDGDWFATDLDGCIALFAGGDAGPIPEVAVLDATGDALAVLHKADRARRDQMKEQAVNMRQPPAQPAYRAAGRQMISEPVFDLPKTIDMNTLHESPTTGYPHLVFGRDGLREGVSDVETIEAIVRDPGAFALIFPSLGPVLYESIHEHNLCRGCRTLDPPDDPRLRAPELMAASGIYAYLHPIEGELYTEYDYARVCSPTIPTHHGDIDPLVSSCASRVHVPFRFEETLSVSVEQIRSLGPISKRPSRR